MTQTYDYSYGNGAWWPTSSQLTQLRMTLDSIRNQYQLSPTSKGLATPLYDQLLSYLPPPIHDASQSGAGKTYLQVYTWISGARDVNAGSGVFSEYIRNYTAEQYRLRVGDISAKDLDGKLNAASNEIAINLIQGMLDHNGVLPSIEGIGIIDGGAAASELFTGDLFPDGDFTGWSGAILFSFIGYDRFFKEWLLSPDDVNGRILNGQVQSEITIKAQSGTYDLFSALYANIKAIESYDRESQFFAFLQSFTTIDQDQKDLIQATNDYMTRMYDLPSDHVFRAGERLPYASAYTWLTSELGIKVMSLATGSLSDIEAYNDSKIYTNYIVHGTDESEGLVGFVNATENGLPYGSTLFDAGGGDYDQLSYSENADASTYLHIVLEQIDSPLYQHRLSIGKYRDGSGEWGHDYAYSVEEIYNTHTKDIVSIHDIPQLSSDMFLTAVGEGATLDLSHLSRPLNNNVMTSTGVIHTTGSGQIFTTANNIIGTPYNDVITSEAYHIIEGGPGKNLITGGAQANIFVVGRGADTITDADEQDRLVVRVPDAPVGNLTSEALTLLGGVILRSSSDIPGAPVTLAAGETAVFYPVVPSPQFFNGELSSNFTAIDERVKNTFQVTYKLQGPDLKVTTKVLLGGNLTINETLVQDYKPGDLGLEFRELIIPNYTLAASDQMPMQSIVDMYISAQQNLLEEWSTLPTPPDLWA